MGHYIVDISYLPPLKLLGTANGRCVREATFVPLLRFYKVTILESINATGERQASVLLDARLRS
jgi:hypothetical protein